MKPQVGQQVHLASDVIGPVSTVPRNSIGTIIRSLKGEQSLYQVEFSDGTHLDLYEDEFHVIVEELKESRTQACDQCPFSKNCERGALGGSFPEVYIGQAWAGFIIPCHKTIDYSDPNWKTNCFTSATQCAGLAIFRANCGLDPEQSPAAEQVRAMGQNYATQLKLEAGSDPNVFTSAEEFLAHHSGLRLDDGFALKVATAYLQEKPPQLWARVEMNKSSMQMRMVAKPQDQPKE